MSLKSILRKHIDTKAIINSLLSSLILAFIVFILTTIYNRIFKDIDFLSAIKSTWIFLNRPLGWFWIIPCFIVFYFTLNSIIKRKYYSKEEISTILNSKVDKSIFEYFLEICWKRSIPSHPHYEIYNNEDYYINHYLCDMETATSREISSNDRYLIECALIGLKIELQNRGNYITADELNRIKKTTSMINDNFLSTQIESFPEFNLTVQQHHQV